VSWICKAPIWSASQGWHLGCVSSREPGCQFERVPQAPRHLDPELGEQAADHVHQLRALLDQQVARPVQRQRRLLLGRLHRHKAHARARHRLADGSGVVRIGLTALHIRLHVSGRHQPNLMAELRQFPGPVMGRAARLYADQASRQLGEERHDLRPAQRLANDDVPSCINGVNLEDALGQIDADGGDLHGDGSCICVAAALTATTSWHRDAVSRSGSHPPHLLSGPVSSRG
jgi:hypothetical protein